MFRRLTSRSDLPLEGAAFAWLIRNQRASIGMIVTLRARGKRQTQCEGLRLGHRPPREVEGRGGVRHIARHGAILRADQRGVLPAQGVLAVTELALLLVDGLALSGSSAALRQTNAVRTDADVPECKVGFG